MKRQPNKKRTVGVQPKDKTQWHKGRLCAIQNNAIFIRPSQALPNGFKHKDVYLNPGNISKYILPVKDHDSVEFVLGDRDKQRPMARKVKVTHYSMRACQEVREFIEQLTDNLKSAECKTVLMEVLPNTAMWNFLGSPVFEEDTDRLPYINDLLEVLKLILRVGKAYKTHLEEMLKTLTQGSLFKASDDKSIPAMIKSSIYIPDRDKFYTYDLKPLSMPSECFRSFCQDAVSQVPSIARSLLPTVTAISERIPSPSTQSFLCSFLSQALSAESIASGNEDVWQELPFIPTENELSGNLVEEDKHLSEVRNSYSDAESYMDTYFRLLRAETFSKIQHGIKDLKACELDERDMNVYHNIHLAGFEMQNGRFSIAVYFTPAKKVKNWKTSPQLMFGNLVCISLNRKFDDVIWAVVSNRDADLLNKHQIIMLEMIDENFKNMSRIISSLQAHAGAGVMVESPTYYHSLSPVLRSLKEFDMENFPLKDEVVHSRSTSDLPEYLKQANTVNTRSIYQLKSTRFMDWEFRDDIANGEMNFQRFLDVFDVHSNTSLEKSQCVALKQALMNRLAIIQGPPGCGKTFIGVKIVQLLLSLSPKLDKPILLLTYKNHALDEFLKHMLEFCSKDDLVRIGSRSKEPELESCNLQEIMRAQARHTSYSKTTYAEIQETRDEIRDVEAQIKTLSAGMDASSHLTKRSLIAKLTEEQLLSLLIDAPLTYKENKKTVDKSRVQGMINEARNSFGSMENFLLSYLDKAVQKNEQLTFVFSLFDRVLGMWMPDRQEPQRMKAFQAEFVRRVCWETEETVKKKDGATTSDAADEDSGDEEHVNELQEARMFSGFKQGEGPKDGLVLFTSFKKPTINQKKEDGNVLIDISDYPNDIQVGSQIRSVKNLWQLNRIERLQFLYCILSEATSSTSEVFDDLIERLENLKKRKEELEMNKKVEMLLQKKIIGVTITGASIHHDLLHHIGPSVVIVEEAAEILEPSLLAALTSSIAHLILIGDHKQLRPQLDTYELCKNFHFDKSMMERLIDSKFPYRTLTKQNRMRPEFSALLKDIYPKLQDNLELVLKNEPLKCLSKSMFFWSHENPEKKERTYTNEKEAARVVWLVLYLLWSGCRPSDITVLSAYLGQTKLLRNLIKQVKAKYPELFLETDEETVEREGFVQVQTIDMYQGDENKYVLISLVRSNSNGSIGFLKEWNRRCVAQSRAKCGMYFVGNAQLLMNARNSCWNALIGAMTQQECSGNAIPLRCSKHAASIYNAEDDDQMKNVMTDPKLLCKDMCGQLYSCGLHKCKRMCQPRHHHGPCVEIVIGIFPKCRHRVKKKCQQDISTMSCRKEVRVVLEQCGHEKTKECHQRNCDILCDEIVPAVFPRCGHKIEKKCYEKIEDKSCEYPCEKINSCGEHRCVSLCGKPHSHDSCSKMVDYQFPGCKHPSPKKKKCSEPITWNCSYAVFITGPCGHPIEKQCYQKDDEVKCPIKPCGRKRKCGHPCKNACGDDCEKGECKTCVDEIKEKMKKFHEDAKKKVKDLEDRIQKNPDRNFLIEELVPSVAEYSDVNDLVVKFVQPMHRWFPKVIKVEKVINLVLEKKFEEAKSKAFGDYIALKFHGTDDNGVKGITRNGFRMPDPNPLPSQRGMFGQGIYFATDSSKSAQHIYTKGSQKLLLCQVLLGKTKLVDQADYTLNKTKLISHGYDSVHAPRGSAVRNDEFVIFDPDQALPKYIIHFSDSNKVVPPSPTTLTNRRFFLQNMIASRKVNFQDPFEMYYNFAESHFRRMAAKTNLQPATISSIDIVINKDLEDKFEATRGKFKSQGIPDDEILAYHGTNKANIPSILKSNLQLSFARRQAYGRGNYFSEYPSISLGYGDGLLLCRILPGKEFVDNSHSNIPPNYNSKKVLLRNQPGNASAANASGEMIIIENSDQILPFFVIHR